MRLSTDERVAASRDPIASLHRLAPHHPGFSRLLTALADRHPTSLEWHVRAQRAAAALPGQIPYESPLLPLYVDHAHGGRIVDVDGVELVDCHLGYTASLLGHGLDVVRDAIRRAAEASVGPGLAVPAQVRLCELVCVLTRAERAALFHTGGEALAAATRLARAATGRTVVAKFEGCYHGATDLGLHSTTMLLTGRLPDGPPDTMMATPATAGLDPAAANSLLVLPYGETVALERIAAAAGALAAVVVDPTPPFAAARFDDLGPFLRELRAVTAAEGIPLIVDEVVSGFRLGRGGAQEAFGFRGDMTCYGKIVSGGLPLAVLAGRADLLDLARTDGVLADYRANKTWVTSTFAANPVAVAAALAQLGYLANHHGEVFAAVQAAQAQLRLAVAEIRVRTGIAISVDGHPCLQPILTLGDPEPQQAVPGEGWYRAAVRTGTRQHFATMLALTLYLRYFGVYAKSAPTMATSAAHNDDDLDIVAAAIERALERMVADGFALPDAVR